MTGTEASKACARVVAAAIRSTRKFNKGEHAACMKGFSELRKAHPAYSDEIDEHITAISNLSAFSKDLAKAGLVSEGEPSAWAVEIGEELDAIATREVKELKSL